MTIGTGYKWGTYVAPRSTFVMASTSWGQFVTIMTHELSHVETGSRANGQFYPIWFDEGLAVHIAISVGKSSCPSNLAKGIDDLTKLSGSQAWLANVNISDDMDQRTYCQARAEVGAWIAKRGNAAIVQLLQAVAQGQSFTSLYGAMQTQ